MNKVTVTYDKGRSHIELDFDISKKTLNDFLGQLAQAIPSAVVNLKAVTAEADKTEETPSADQSSKEEKVEITPDA